VGKIKVVNKYGWKGNGGVDVVIMRGTPLGNPFVIGRDGNRDEVVDKYLPYLRNEWKKGGKVKNKLLEIKKLVESGSDVNLVCCCKPKRCHGDVIKYAVERIAK